MIYMRPQEIVEIFGPFIDRDREHQVVEQSVKGERHE